MSEPRRQQMRPALVGLAVAAALGFAACGDDEETTSAAPTTTTTTGVTGTTGATGEAGAGGLAVIESSLEDAGYDVFPVGKPFSKGGAAESNGATDGIYANKGDLAAEVFLFPTPEDAESYVDQVQVDSRGSPTAVAGAIGFSAAQDDDQAALDELVVASGAS